MVFGLIEDVLDQPEIHDGIWRQRRAEVGDVLAFGILERGIELAANLVTFESQFADLALVELSPEEAEINRGHAVLLLHEHEQQHSQADEQDPPEDSTAEAHAAGGVGVASIFSAVARLFGALISHNSSFGQKTCRPQ